MRSVFTAAAAISIVCSSAAHAGIRLAAPGVTVGRNLQVVTNLELAEPAGELMTVTLTSSDPERLLLSTAPDKLGVASIKVTIHPRSRFSTDFFVCGLAESGTVGYTASAPGIENVKGTVTLAPSGIVFTRAGIPVSAIQTTRGMKAELGLSSAVLDESRNYAGPQLVAGGRTVVVDLISSDARVGNTTATVAIYGGTLSTGITFRPAAAGIATLLLKPYAGFGIAANFSTLTATVITPGISVTDGVTVGQNLQVEAAINLGEPAPNEGVEVELSSDQPGQLLLSPSGAQVGSGSIKLFFPPAPFKRPTTYRRSGTAER
jgi:hypothetical protein